MTPDEYWILFAARSKANERHKAASNGGKQSHTNAWVDRAHKAMKEAKDANN